MSTENTEKKSIFKAFPFNYWVVILMEFFERGSYYGVTSVIYVYMVLELSAGGLGFSKESVGVIKSTITPLLYFLPILSGAIADRYGYRMTLVFAFITMSAGYFLTGLATDYSMVFLSLILMVTGAGFFKPIISGTIARTTDKSNSTVGFGIFYWSINLGAFIFPLILVPLLKQYSYSYIFFMAAIVTGSLLILNLFVYKEPTRAEDTAKKSILNVLKDAVIVLKDVRFVVLIVLYSGFWVLYFQMFDTVLWYMQRFVDTTAISNVVNSVLGIFITNPQWKFDVEHVTVMNAGTIILLQILVSNIVKNRKSLPTMITGIGIGTVGMAILAISTSPWVFLAGIVIFSIGEMTTHPKFISYVGLIAPPDKKALYLGYAFLYGVIGGGISGVLGANLYVKFIESSATPQPHLLWLSLSSIGVVSMVGLYLFNKFLAPKNSDI
ncbi:MAG: MFS transporter [Ignavibacteriaceae bacterium]|nr:MFS transporter [Ignavibacteriaceae bacterium]